MLSLGSHVCVLYRASKSNIRPATLHPKLSPYQAHVLTSSYQAHVITLSRCFLPLPLQAMRLFVGAPVWTPLNRPQEEHASRAKYLQDFADSKAVAAA
jgi:hypothetical protein